MKRKVSAPEPVDPDTPSASRKADRYCIPVLAKALDLLDCFDPGGGAMTLAEVVRRTGTSHTTAYRILHTLASRSYLERSGAEYRLNRLRRRPVLGFANCSRHIALAVDIQDSLEAAARAVGIDLMIWDNDRNAETAIKNAQVMVEHKVDIAIEFQLYEQVAPVISDIFSRVGIPLISLINPIYGTQYFGVDNYRAGLSAGLAMGEFAKRHWRAAPDTVVLLESPRAGRMVQSRLVGAIRGIEDRLGPLEDSTIEHLDGGGEREPSSAAVASFFKSRQRGRTIIVAINDESALGAAEVIKRTRANGNTVTVGFGGGAEILEMIARQTHPCVGTVSFNAENYGPALIKYALPSSRQRSASPVCYVPHQYLDRDALVSRKMAVNS